MMNATGGWSVLCTCSPIVRTHWNARHHASWGWSVLRTCSPMHPGAINSAGECYLHTVEAGSSNLPSPRTNFMHFLYLQKFKSRSNDFYPGRSALNDAMNSAQLIPKESKEIKA